MAPYAILSHLDIVHLDKEEIDASDQLETLPILFTSHKNYEESFGCFSVSLKNGYDSVETNDKEFNIEGGCVVQHNRAGEFLFCEAVKVDGDLKKNA